MKKKLTRGVSAHVTSGRRSSVKTKNSPAVMCVRMLYPFELLTSDNVIVSLRPGDIVCVTSLGPLDSSIKTQRKGAEERSTWWLGYSVQRRGFEGWFPNSFAVPLDFSSDMKLCHVLEDPLGHILFEEFVIGEHCDENIKFWRVASFFEYEMYQVDADQLVGDAKEIYDYFVDNGSPHMVNISSKTRKDIAESVTGAIDGKCTLLSTVFNRALVEVFKVLDRDQYMSFRRSPQFAQFLSTRNRVSSVRNRPNTKT